MNELTTFHTTTPTSLFGITRMYLHMYKMSNRVFFKIEKKTRTIV